MSTTTYEEETEPFKIGILLCPSCSSYYLLLFLMTFLFADTFNSFVSVAIEKTNSGANSRISCIFNNVPPTEVKRCNLRHGPVADNCNNLYLKIHASIAGVNIINFVDLNLTYVGNTTRICIALEAFSGDEFWELVGIYDTGTGLLMSSLTINDTTPTSPLITVTSPKRSSAETSISPILISIYGLVVSILVMHKYMI